MKNTTVATIALAIATLAAGQAMAADNAAPKTREEVRAELLEAQRNRTSLDQKESYSGLTYRELAEAMKPVVKSTQVTAAQKTSDSAAKVSFTE
ncbi:DUF4148 domain-containing protein [Rhodoferax saidenbachensis]|uniref:DUF4148 domain-containing protein n=1 Tax=Rhodoferax saidenbachensis TaxID=1484693 RepID=A0A1P8KDA3_9BURK|nr:DUF4148 domain-containing protein [Rhodoferax saidenbachensis]APW43965.1 hypothetical protein RS694_16450 [Rhodoferax saidenbachensis]